MLYRPLFWTSFWAEDWLFTAPNKPYNGATTILISSASAKTAFCLAYLIKKRSYPGVRVIGLTSKENLNFTRGLGLYSSVFTYGDVEGGLGEYNGTWIYVDVAGNEANNSRVWKMLGSRVVRSVSLGVTNLSPSTQSTYIMPVSGVTKSPTTRAPAASSPVEFFFMPEWLADRRRSLTASDIFKMQQAAWTALMRDCRAWVVLERTWGAEEVQRIYAETVRGRVGPEKGMVWCLWDEPEDSCWEKKDRLTSESVLGKL
jgi:Protein of unknown function (DUF2855)